MEMMLLLFLDSVHSERELMRIIPERLDYMWFLGYGLDGTRFGAGCCNPGSNTTSLP